MSNPILSEDEPIFTKEMMHPQAFSQKGSRQNQSGNVSTSSMLDKAMVDHTSAVAPYYGVHQSTKETNAWTKKDVPEIELTGVAIARTQELAFPTQVVQANSSLYDMNPMVVGSTGILEASFVAPEKRDELYRAGKPSMHDYVQPRGLIWRDDIPQPKIKTSDPWTLHGSSTRKVADDPDSSRINVSAAQGLFLAPLDSNQTESSNKLSAAQQVLELANAPGNDSNGLPPEVWQTIDKVSVEEFLRRRIQTGKLTKRVFSHEPAVGIARYRWTIFWGVFGALILTTVAICIASTDFFSGLRVHETYLAAALCCEVIACIIALSLLFVLGCNMMEHTKYISKSIFCILTLWSVVAGMSTAIIETIGGLSSIITVVCLLVVPLKVLLVVTLALSNKSEQPTITLPGSLRDSEMDKRQEDEKPEPLNLRRVPIASIDMDLALRELVRLANELQNSEANAVQEHQGFHLQMYNMKKKMEEDRLELLKLQHTNKVLGAQVIALLNEAPRIQDQDNLMTLTDAKLRELEKIHKNANETNEGILKNEKMYHVKEVSVLEERLILLDNELATHKALLINERSNHADARRIITNIEAKNNEFLEELLENRRKSARNEKEILDLQSKMNSLLQRCRILEQLLEAEKATAAQREEVAMRGIQIAESAKALEAKRDEFQQMVTDFNELKKKADEQAVELQEAIRTIQHLETLTKDHDRVQSHMETLEQTRERLSTAVAIAEGLNKSSSIGTPSLIQD